jgi:hypothetical protein
MNKKLDIVVIFRQIDEHYLIDLQKSIPDYAKLILVTTVEGKKDRLIILENNEVQTLAVLEYTDVFSFSYARNKALSLSENKFILSLDADERLLQHQHQQLLEYLELFDKIDNFGGAMVYNFSVKTAQQNKYGLYPYECMPQTKLFVKGSFWTGDIHENINIPKGTILFTTPLLIHHVGYEISKERAVEKLEEYHFIALNEKRQEITKVQKEQLTTKNVLEILKQSLINRSA